MGDFNSHHTLCGCTDINNKGRTIGDFVIRHDLVLLNDRSSTYLHPATDSYSSLDLSLLNAALDFFPDFDGKVVDDFHGSDHFLTLFLRYVGNSIKQTGNSLEFTENKQLIPMLSKIVKIKHNFSLPYFIRPQRWKLHNSNWEQFRVHCEQTVHPNAELFTSLIYSAAEKSIPRTSTNPKRPNKTWFNDDRKKATAKRMSVLRQFNLRPIQENLSKFKIARAKARRIIKQSKLASWRKYVSRLNSRSSVKKAWDTFRKVNGKNSSLKFGHLNVGDDVVTSKADIADVLAYSLQRSPLLQIIRCHFKNFKTLKQSKLSRIIMNITIKISL